MGENGYFEPNELDDKQSRTIEQRLVAMANDEDVLQDEWGDQHDQDVDRERDGEL